MRKRKAVGLAVLVGGPLYLRRRRERARERVHIHFDDGSAITLTDDGPGGEQMLALARPAL